MENIKKSYGGQSGFTLIEVLLATFILAFGLLSVATAFGNGMLILANTPFQLAAKELAYEIIDEITLKYDTDVVITTGPYPLENGGKGMMRKDRVFDAVANVTDNGSDLAVTVTITYLIGGKARIYTTPTAIINPII